MNKCPVCYSEIKDDKCTGCALHLMEWEWIVLKADTYDSIVNHLFESGKDDRRREQIRTKIALKNIKKWAQNHLPGSLEH